jgi:hypothetical protein
MKTLQHTSSEMLCGSDVGANGPKLGIGEASIPLLGFSE